MNHKASSCHLSRGLQKAKLFGQSSAEACLSLAFKASKIQIQTFGQRCVLVFYEKRQEAAVNHEASSCYLSRGLLKAKVFGRGWSVSIFGFQLQHLKFNIINLSKFTTRFFLKRGCCESCHLSRDLLMLHFCISHIRPIWIFFQPNVGLWIRPKRI